MAFGLATSTTSAAKTNTWATASARSASFRRNNAARSVGLAVSTCKNKLGLKSVNSSSKVSSFSTCSLSDASTVLSDDSMSLSRPSTASTSDTLSPTSLPGTPGQLERGSSSSFSSTSDGSLPGSLCTDEESQQPKPRRERGSSVKRRARSPDHFSRISLKLGKAACGSSLAVREACKAADKDQDGFLTALDMEDFFRHFGMPSTDASIFFYLLNKDSSGRVCWREVVAILMPIFKQVTPKQDSADFVTQFAQEIMDENDEP